MTNKTLKKTLKFSNLLLGVTIRKYAENQEYLIYVYDLSSMWWEIYHVE